MHVDSIDLLTMTVMYGAAKVTAAAISPATLVPVPRTLVGIISVAWTHITYQPTLDDSLEHKVDKIHKVAFLTVVGSEIYSGR